VPDYLLIIILIISSQKYIKILQYSNVYQVVECYLKKEISYRLFYAFIRPHYQSILNLYPILSRSKQHQLEALNRKKIFRIVNRWHDATNIEVTNLPAYKSIEHLTQIHYVKLCTTIIRSNPSIISDYIQHKLYLLLLKEYFVNPFLLKEKRTIVGRGRTPNRIRKFIMACTPTLFDRVFSFVE
jgi:hypothetical protein